MPRVLKISWLRALMLVTLLVGCDKDGNDKPINIDVPDAQDQGPFSIDLFDSRDQGFGDAPVAVRYVWRITNHGVRPLTCVIDHEGDGTEDIKVPGCNEDTTQMASQDLPSHVFAAVGAHKPRLRVFDDAGHERSASMEVFANQVTYNPKTIFPEKLPGFLDARIVSLEQVILVFEDGAKTPDLEVGSILLGQSEGGYLLKVSSFTKNGGELVVQGTPAKLEEAVQDGFFGARDVTVSYEKGTCLGDSECKDFDIRPAVDAQRPEAQPRLKTYRSGSVPQSEFIGLRISLPKIKELGESSLFVGLRIKKVVVDIGWFKIKQLYLEATPEISGKFEIQQEFPKTFPLGRISLGTWFLGPVMINPVFIPQLKVGATIKGLVIETGVRLPFSIVKDDNGFHVSMVPEKTGSILWGVEPVLAITRGARVEASIIGQLDILIAGVGGPYVAPKLSCFGTATDRPAENRLCFTAGTSVGVDVGFEIPYVPGASTKIATFSGEMANFYNECFGGDSNPETQPPNTTQPPQTPPEPLKRGDTGAAVTSLQKEYVSLSLLAASDVVGNFGPKTEAITRAIQSYAINDSGPSVYPGVVLNGQVDKATRAVIDHLLAMLSRIDPSTHVPEYIRYDIASKIKKYLA